MKLRIWLVSAACFALVAGVSGCSSRNIHPELEADKSVLVRKWTLPTNPMFGQGEAGDRGTEYSNAILVENTLIFGSRNSGLVAIYPKMMEVRWSLPIKGGVVSEITVDRGSAYFGGGDGHLYSVNTENGRVNWRYDLRNPQISRPTVEGGRLFVATTDDTVYAFDAGTGKWLWHYPRRSSLSAHILGASAPLVDGNDVIAGLSDGFLVALSVQDGQLKWERKLHQGTRFIDVDAHPILNEGTIYVPSYDGSLYALKRQGGQVVWRFDAGGSNQVLVEDQKLYLPSSDGSIYALQKSSAKVLWKFEMDGGVPTQLISTEKHLVVGSSMQYLYVIDKATGKGVYRFNAGYESGFTSSPAYDVAQQRMYFLSGAGNLYAFAFRQPRPKARWGGSDPYEFAFTPRAVSTK